MSHKKSVIKKILGKKKKKTTYRQLILLLNLNAKENWDETKIHILVWKFYLRFIWNSTNTLNILLWWKGWLDAKNYFYKSISFYDFKFYHIVSIWYLQINIYFSFDDSFGLNSSLKKIYLTCIMINIKCSIIGFIFLSKLEQWINHSILLPLKSLAWQPFLI